MEKIPFKQMWPDDILWFPHFLAKKPFYGYFTFQGMDKIVDYVLEDNVDLSTVKIPDRPLLKPQMISNNS